MEYFAPETLDDAIALLASAEDARCLAGGQTLVAMMNTRIIQPLRLVSLRKITALSEMDILADGGRRIGAMVTHEQLAGLDASGSHSLLPQTARQIASPAIRAFGTIGGSLCHADPAADWPTALVALNAEATIEGPAGSRAEPVTDFIVDMLATSLDDAEILKAIVIPPAAPVSGASYVKLARVEGDFATVSVAVTLVLDKGDCSDIRIVVGGCGPVPCRLPAVDNALAGTQLTGESVKRAGEELAAAVQPEDDGRATAEYRRMVVPGLVVRAVARAKAAAGATSA